MNNKILLLGDEAIAKGGLDAGMSGMYAYPGTPSTEIMEYVQADSYAIENKIHSTWSSNEKTAMEAALGMSYTGKRAMVCMKHVGLNVAADPFINAALTGINGGLIVVVADDPSMHSSQNEQDSRFYGKFALLPTLEPSNQQEAYDMAFTGFELSEKYKLPVLMRITTRLSHSRASIITRELLPQNELKLPDDLRQFVLLPAIARARYKLHLAAQKNIEADSEVSLYNSYTDSDDKSLGIIACGIAINYLNEHYPDGKIPFPVLKISHYPTPVALIERLLHDCNEILVLEEGYPFVEEQLRGIPVNPKIKGRLDGTIQRDGELDPDKVAKALGLPVSIGFEVPKIIANRPPLLCQGCAHIDIYLALNEAIKPFGYGRVFSDIGCYTLGALEPYNAINSCVDMGASVTMAKGAADAGLIPSIAVIGDSTFTHSGMTGLLDAVIDKSPITVIIADNATTAMTGGQQSAATGRLREICEGLGVEKEHIHVIEPLKKNHGLMVDLMQQEFAYNGVSVIIPQRECIQTLRRKKQNS